MSRVLVISPDEVKKEMAGPAIRAFEIAKHLGKGHQVTLAHRPENLASLISQNDVIICQHLALTHYPVLRNCNKSLVFDLYNLSMFECLEIAIQEPAQYQALFGEYSPLLNVYIEVLKTADFFICANEQQRDFWLGMLAALGRIDIKRYRDDGNLKNLIDIVPFGISNEPPSHVRSALKGVYPGIGLQDKVLIWAGGVYDWLDPLTSIKAMHKVSAVRPEVKLFFMGIENPHQPGPKMRLCQQAVRLSKDLGLYDKHVFFNGWVGYNERQNYLLESDVGITTHHKDMEAYFSSRTRVLDYIWSALPIIISEGDGFSGIVKRYNLGLVVRDNDAEALAKAILKLLDDQDFYRNCKKNLRDIAPEFYWERVIEPLNRFCYSPRITQDRSGNITLNNSLFFFISQMPFYLSYFGYRGLMIKLFKRIFRRLKHSVNIYTDKLGKILISVFSLFVLAITFAAVLFNDIIFMPVYRRNKQ